MCIVINEEVTVRFPILCCLHLKCHCDWVVPVSPRSCTMRVLLCLALSSFLVYVSLSHLFPVIMVFFPLYPHQRQHFLTFTFTQCKCKYNQSFQLMVAGNFVTRVIGVIINLFKFSLTTYICLYIQVLWGDRPDTGQDRQRDEAHRHQRLPCRRWQRYRQQVRTYWHLLS